MNAVTRQEMSLEEFLAWEEQQELRWEYDGSQPVTMVGGTLNHSRIQRNVIVALGNRLRGPPYEVLTSDLKIEAAGSIRYPDAFVARGGGPGSSKVVRDPVVVFELVSPSTARTDRIIKNQQFKATPSILRYVLLEQDDVAATMFERAGEDWAGHILAAGDVLRMPEIGVEAPLAEFYEGA